MGKKTHLEQARRVLVFLLVAVMLLTGAPTIFAVESSLPSPGEPEKESKNGEIKASFTAPAPSGGDDTAALQAILDAASDGDVIRLEAGTYSVSTALVIQNKAITLRGEGNSLTTISLDNHVGFGASTPRSYENAALFVHFTSDSTAVGDVVISNMNIVSSETSSRSISMNITDVSPNKNKVILESTNLLRKKGAANDTTYSSALQINQWVALDSSDENQFDVVVNNSTFNGDGAFGIGIGPATSAEGKSDFSTSTLKVTNSVFGDVLRQRYGIHGAYPMDVLTVDNSRFVMNSAGGIKIQEDADSFTSITNSDFSEMKAPGSEFTSAWQYAIMVTNGVTGNIDPQSYHWLDVLSGNDFSGQNLLLLERSKDLEVIWFPGDDNIIDESTRLVRSGSSTNKAIAYLTGFHTEEDLLVFQSPTAADQNVTIRYCPDCSDSYVMQDYWTDDNPPHVSNVSTLTSRQQSEAITRYTIEDPTIADIVRDDTGNPVFTADRQLQITPKAPGRTKLFITVGEGPDGTYPNARTVAVDILVLGPAGFTLENTVSDTTGKPGSEEEFTFIINRNQGELVGQYSINGGPVSYLPSDGKIVLKAGQKVVFSGMAEGSHSVMEMKPTHKYYDTTFFSIDGGDLSEGLFATLDLTADSTPALLYLNQYEDIPKPPTPEEPVPTPVPDNPDNPPGTVTKTKEAPETGDGSMVALAALLMLGAAGACLAMKKRKNI